MALTFPECAQAQGLLHEALSLQPDMAESYFNLGNMERRRGNAQRALSYLKTCTQNVPRGSRWPPACLKSMCLMCVYRGVS